MGEGRDFKFGGQVTHSIFQPADDKLSLKGRGQGQLPILGLYTPLNISQTAEARIVKRCVAVGYIKF